MKTTEQNKKVAAMWRKVEQAFRRPPSRRTKAQADLSSEGLCYAAVILNNQSPRFDSASSLIMDRQISVERHQRGCIPAYFAPCRSGSGVTRYGRPHNRGDDIARANLAEKFALELDPYSEPLPL